MLKSELIKHLTNNLAKHGDGEIKVEVLTDLNENGKEYEIEDVTNTVGFEFEIDYITVFEKKNDFKLYTNIEGHNLYKRKKVFTAWTDEDDVENNFEVIIDKIHVIDIGYGFFKIDPYHEVEFIQFQ